MNPIVEKNLEMMAGEGPGHLVHLVQGERMDVENSTTIDGHEFLCANANFYYDAHGLIKYLGNSRDVPDEIVVSCGHGIFRVAYDSTKSPYANFDSMDPAERKKLIIHGAPAKDMLKAYRIVGIMQLPGNVLEGEAKRNLVETMEAFNERYGF